MAKITCKYPLNWPANKPRTRASEKKLGRFHKSGGSYHSREVTIHEAIVRVYNQIGMFSPGAYHTVIQPDDCVLRTMLQVNKNGSFRANQRKPPDAGAVLTFPYRGRDVVIAIDVYTKIGQNIAAIAATLESLRTLQRHDSALLDAAVTGFTALPAPVVTRHWRDVFGVDACATLKEVRKHYMRAAGINHPDKGGCDAAMSEINRAWADAQAELEGAI